jgi:hypothetical protein
MSDMPQPVGYQSSTWTDKLKHIGHLCYPLTLPSINPPLNNVTCDYSQNYGEC